MLLKMILFMYKLEFYMADDKHREILHQVGAKLQESENQNPIKLHQLGAEIVSTNRISSILNDGGMLPVFGIVPWKHHLLLISKCKSIEEALYYMARSIDEGLSRRELEDVIDDDDFGKHGKALTNFDSRLPAPQSQLATNVLNDPYRLYFLMLEKGYDEHDLENAIARDITRFLLELGNGFTYIGRQPDDNPTIGLLLCKSKDQTKVEWAFDSIQNPMGVATYEGIKIMYRLSSV